MQAEPRQFTDDMREISGFGGGYEQQCRAMVLAGLDWLDAHPDADPKFHGYSGVYGIATEDNDDAKRSPRRSSPRPPTAPGPCTKRP
jgi:hypothetical protein